MKPTLLLSCMILALSSAPSFGADSSVAPRFGVSGYRVEGNTLLDPSEVQRILAPFTGPDSDFGTVQQGLEALQDAYRKRGYSTVHVLLPEQELEQGAVRLVVAESRIGTVKVEGNSSFDAENIRRSVPGLKEGEVPDIDEIAASLAVANEHPAKKSTLSLQSGTRDDQLVARVVVADERPWRAGLSTDNTGSPQTGEWRLTAFLQHSNLFNRDHILTFQYTTSPEKPSQVGVYSASYRIPLYSWGDSIDLFGGYSDVDSGTFASGSLDLRVNGRGIISGIRYNQNLKRIGSWGHRLVYGFDYRLYENAIDIIGIPIGSEVAVHPFSVSYSGDWKGEGIEGNLFLTLLQNIPGGDRGGDADFANAGAGISDYRLMRYGGQVRIALPGDWQERLLFHGQYTDNRLVSGEQFGLGGADSIRGFLERELSGDWGHVATEELYSSNVCRYISVSSVDCRLLGFFDVGHAVRVRPQPGETGNSLVAGGGIGLRIGAGRWFSFAVDYAIVALDGGSREAGDDRVHLKATLLF